VQVVAGELAVEQLHAADFDDAVAAFGRQTGGFGVQNNLAHDMLPAVVFLGVVDRVLGDLDHHVLLRQDGLAAQARVGLQPQARSSRSSSFSSSSLSEAKPSRTMTWQVVQAQLMSQACSMLMWLSSSASQMEVPAGAVTSAPCGQYSGGAGF
jgi:hypothetical protein